MKFAICNETFGDWPLDRALQMVAELGYRGWEVAPFMLADDILKFTATQRYEYRRQVNAHGLEVIGLHWLLAKTTGFHLTSPERQVRIRTAHYLGELARLCADLGGSFMVLGSPLQRNLEPGQDEASAFANAAEVLQTVLPVLVETNVVLALEPLGPAETNFMNTAAQARYLQAMVGDAHIALHLDMKAMSSESKSIPELLREHQDWMVHFHANDPNRQGPGMGELDIQPVFDTLREIQYPGWISVEVFDYDPGIETLVRESMQNMQRACSTPRRMHPDNS